MSWEQLRAIVARDAAERDFWDRQPPRACPNDGTPLELGPDGVLFCRHDGWRWAGAA